MIFRIIFLILLIINFSSKAEIIENRKIINKSFDVWNVSCEDDEMLNYVRCRLFAEITEKTTFFVNPQSNNNKILIVSEDGYYDRRFFIKIDDNGLITSNDFTVNKYNIVNFSPKDIKNMYNQLQKGITMYLRFTIKDNTSVNGFREITAKLSLTEFQKALIYFNKQVNKYNFNIN